ncbi:MAG: efflux RND transporter permease subunit [Spirochaetes bacterium]|nr:efflux RND transporter permease subunit [Spirochaetota bacterium]
MNLPSLGVRRPVLTSVVFIIILIIGIISLANLPLEFLPDISFPFLTVITSYEGTGPEEIESSITKIIEGAVSTVPNIKKVYSTSMEGLSTVQLEFEWETDLDNAANDVRDNLDQVRAYLPSEASKPYLLKFSTENIPVIMMGIRAKESYPKLYKITEEKITDVLKQVDGVGNALAVGGMIREIRVDLNQAKINSYNITIDQILGSIRGNNVFIPGGEIKIGKSEYILRIPAEYRTIDEIRNIAVGNSKGIPVYLKDVARVNDSFKEENMIVRVEGDSGIMVIVQKQSKANTVIVANKVREQLEKIKKTLPEDVAIEISFDTSQFIKDSIGTLTTTIAWGGLFVLIIVLLFLVDWKGSFVIALTIPFSLIAAFIILFLLGYTINIMSLSSLAIAIGMVVDNAIVVTENIYRHRFDEKMEVKKASVQGAGEVLQAVMASTLTTVAIFIPIFFVTGIVNIFFRELSLSIITVLSTSLFVSLFLTPMVASLVFNKKPTQTFFVRAEKANTNIMNKIKEQYKKILQWTLYHRKSTVFIALGIFLFSLFILIFFVGREFMPKEDQGMVMGTIEMEGNTRVEVTDQMLKDFEEFIKKNVPETKLIMTRSGKSPGGRAAASGREEGANIGFLMLRLVAKAERTRSSQDILALINKELKKVPGVKSIDMSTEGGMSGFGSAKPIVIEIYGYDLDQTMQFAQDIKKTLSRVKGTGNIVISRKAGKPEIQIQIDKKKAQDLGLTLYQIADSVKNSFQGVTAAQFRESGDEYDIFVRLQSTDRKSLDNVKNTLIKTPGGQFVSVGNLAKFDVKVGPKSITRKQKERYLTVESEIFKRPLSAVLEDFNKLMKKVPVPSGIRYEISGSAEDIKETFTILIQVFLLGIVLIYLIMAAQFESFRDPFIVMFSVPFAVVGVAWALFLTGVTLNLNSFVGMVMLVGIVVNNAIVLIDYINRVRCNQKKELFEAVISACQLRLRPVLMTAFTTIFGLLPMALARGEGSESWVPLGVSVIGGLFVSTMITLILIPTLYIIFERRIKRDKRIICETY